MGRLADDSLMPVYKVKIIEQYQVVPVCFECRHQMLRTGFTYDPEDTSKIIYHYKCPNCGREEESEICYPYTRSVLDAEHAERIEDPVAFFNTAYKPDTPPDGERYKVECKKLSEITE